jgi:Tol biopolymer transport system component
VFDRLTDDPDIYRFSLTAPPRATIVSSFADFNASFSPDGTRIVYASTRSGDSGDIWVAAADGSGPQRLTGDLAGAHAAPQWSPDGHVIAFASRGADGQTQIWTVDADGGNRRQITRGPGDHLYPSWSRDGASIYFTKVDSAGSNIWRVAALGGRDVQVTREGGYMGFESPDGEGLVYRPRWDRNGTPLLTMPLGGGATRQLVKCMYGFSVGSKDVFYYPCRTETFAWTMTMFEPLDLRAIDPVTGFDRLLGSVGGVADRFWGPSVSPDGTEMLYAKAANEGQDLMVIENFR